MTINVWFAVKLIGSNRILDGANNIALLSRLKFYYQCVKNFFYNQHNCLRLVTDSKYSKQQHGDNLRERRFEKIKQQHVHDVHDYVRYQIWYKRLTAPMIRRFTTVFSSHFLSSHNVLLSNPVRTKSQPSTPWVVIRT